MEFGRTYLWRVGVKPEYDWQKKPRAMYVVMPTKEAAKEYAEKHLNKPHTVGKISNLGVQLGGCLFHG
jgi:hypothetical protein